VFCDGSWGTFGAGAAVVLVAPSKVKTCYAIKLDFSYTNNIAEYEALLLGLRKLKAMGIRRVVLKTIPKLFLVMLTRVVGQETRSLRNTSTQFKGLKLLSKGFL
jgi:ribonuclease HI